MEADKIKEAFARAKQDVFNLQSQLDIIRKELQEIKQILSQQLSPANKQTNNPAYSPTEKVKNKAIQHITPTQDYITPTLPTDNLPLKTPKSPNIRISTGNEGVPTDRQTNQQTDRQTQNSVLNEPHTNINNTHITKSTIETDVINKLEQVSQVLESLDTIKKELRIKFKRLTPQEMTVFSVIYQLEEEGFVVDYPLISKKLSLSESSIRDYTQRILKKGIPIKKTKENNKKIVLSISQDIKKIASLSTILHLREL